MSKKEKISKPEDRQISQEETIIQKRVDVLSYLVRTYDGLTQLLVKTQNRIHALSGKPNPKHDAMIIEMQSTKGKIARQIEKDLDDYAIWKDWLKNVPGIGPWIGAKLILKYYYKNVPICIDCHGVLVKEDGNFICSACGHDSKGDGTLTFRMDDRDFSNISKWWKFMGRHVVDGAVPKRKANQLSDWSQEGRLVGFHIGESFNKQSEDHLYKAFMLSRKKNRLQSTRNGARVMFITRQRMKRSSCSWRTSGLWRG